MKRGNERRETFLPEWRDDELAAESTFCYEFSAASYCNRESTGMQVGSDAMRKMGGLAMEELQGYLALHQGVGQKEGCYSRLRR